LQKDIKKNKKRRAIREDAGSSPNSSYEVDSEQRKMINLDDVREKNEEGDDSYHSEELKSPISTNDEYDNGTKVYPQFNEVAKFGNVHIEVWMDFGNLATFKAIVSDYTIHLGNALSGRRMIKRD
jgi:hypothetical protein